MFSLKDDDFLDLKELKDEITFVDNSEVQEMLKIQLEEVEMLQSMFSNPGEFEIYDYSVLADINEFVEGKSNILPSRLDFTIHLLLEDIKLGVCVNLPLDYPADVPDIFVRSDSLSRTQQHNLNCDLAKYICSLNKGEICIYPAIAWLQENAYSYFIYSSKIKMEKSNIKNVVSNNTFSRHWIYSHHIYSKIKRRCILDIAQELHLTGFCLPGRPGIICVEGLETDCNDWWQREDIKLGVCVNLPLDYPADVPDIFVRSDSLSRTQQHNLNCDLAKYICSLNKGEICIYPAIAWLQENAYSYFIYSSKIKMEKSNIKNVVSNNTFSRHWIYSHHIYSKIKRRCILDIAQELHLTGFCLPGRPGIICVEGLETDCNDWWQRVRCMNWKKIVCRKIEEEKLTEENGLESLRKFTGFKEISFDSCTSKSRDSHMDMGEFYKYLADHECSYVFRDYFGVEGKVNASINQLNLTS